MPKKHGKGTGRRGREGVKGAQSHKRKQREDKLEHRDRQ